MSSSPAYSLENSVRFAWSSITGNLNSERVAHLKKYVCGQEILDAGCGGGAFVEYLCAQGLRVTGLDYHEEFLQVARNRPAAKGTYVQGDITRLPFPDKSFDCTYCFDVLEHVDDQAALAELLRVTRQRLILAVPATDPDSIGWNLTFRHYMDLTHLRTYTPEALQELFHLCGQRRYEIFPELPIALRNAAIQHLDNREVANPIKRALFGIYHAGLRRLLSRARFRTIYTGLVAVIEVANLPSRAEEPAQSPQP